jgi:hypothetical protein
MNAMNKATLAVALVCAMGSMFLMFSAQTVSAQAAVSTKATIENEALRTASFDAEMHLSLPVSEAMPMRYRADWRGLGMASEAQAERFFAAICDNLVQFQVEPGSGYVLVIPQYANLYGKTWNVEEWEAYFASNATRYVNYLERMQQEQR